MRAGILRAGLLAVVMLSLPLSARAQQCAGSRVATPDGYCCWPGQHWNGTNQRCEGPPSCSPPLAASGNECVGPGAVQQPAQEAPVMVHGEGTVDYGSGAASSPAGSVIVQPTGDVGSAWPAAGQIPPSGPRNPRRVQRTDETMQTWGAVLFGIAYLGAVIEGGWVLQRGSFGPDRSCHDGLGASLLVPVVGGLIALAVNETCRIPTYSQWGGVRFRTGSQAGIQGEPAWGILGIASTAVQLLGLGLLLGGSFQTVEAIVYDAEGTELGIGPTYAGGPGVQATLRF